MITSLQSEPRRHDLDALRGLAMLLGIVLHAGMSFMPGPWPVQDQERHWQFGLLFSFIHGFRMPLFFMLSGFFTAMLWERRGVMGMLKHRFHRIVLPLLLSVVTLLPAIHLALQEVSPWKRDGWLTPVVQGNREQVLDRIRQAEDLDYLDPLTGLSMQHAAVLLDRVDILEDLLQAGASADLLSGSQGTPLHSAYVLGRDRAAQILLAHGADPSRKNLLGRTPGEMLQLDWESTRMLSGMMGVWLERDLVMLGRSRIADALNVPGLLPDPGVEATAGVSGIRRGVLGEPIFFHLWFLWFLVWMVAGFGLVVTLLRSLHVHWFPRAWIAGPFRYLWLIPLTTFFQLPQGKVLPVLGPDASMALVPPWYLLGYYAVFFGYGAWWRVSGIQSPHGGWKTGLMTTAGLFVLGMWATYRPDANHLIASVVKSAYAWCACFTALELSRSFFPHPGKRFRYLSEASYWLYLTHLPLLIPLQAWVASWTLSPLLKFPFICILATGILLLAYRLMVQGTLLGRMLCGSRKPVDCH